MTTLFRRICAALALAAAGGAASAEVLDFSKLASGPAAGGALHIRGVNGGGVWFSGQGREDVSVPHGAEVNGTSALTIRAWLWPADSGEHQGIVWKGDRSRIPEGTQYKLSLRPEGTVEFGCQGERGDWMNLLSSVPLPLRRWTLVTATFDRGMAGIFFGEERVAAGAFRRDAGPGSAGLLEALPGNDCPVAVGRFQQPGGRGWYPFRGGMDDLEIVARVLGHPGTVVPPPAVHPLECVRLFDREIRAEALPGTPVLSGQVTGEGPWLLEVAGESGSVWVEGQTGSGGRFRYVLDDYCGALDLPRTGTIRCRGYRFREADDLRLTEVEFLPAPSLIQVSVNPEERRQVLGPVSIYANAPARFLPDPGEQRRVYGPVLAEMREAGVEHFDLAFASLAVIEPVNDDADPDRMNMDAYRAGFLQQKEARNLLQFLAYLRREGFTFGIRSTGFAPWQIAPGPVTGAPCHQVEEIAETWVALLRLMKEENLEPTHLVPVWEPSYPPETVARICAETARLARQHGFVLPVVGPYVIATGGQSMNLQAMPDKYENGAAYVRAYLEACPEAPVIALEDYASGAPLIRPNLERLGREVIEPLSRGRARELWMVEYGAPCGLGPWNFYPSRWHGALSTWESAFRLGRAMNQLLDGGVHRFFFWKAWDSIGETSMVTPSSWGLIKGALHDEERRPPFHAARLYWRHLREGAQVIGCRADDGFPVNAAVRDRDIAVFLLNPRSRPVEALVMVDRTPLAAQARLLTATAEIPYQEREVYSQGENGFRVTLAPRGVHTLLCRRSSSLVRFEQTRWPLPEPEVAHLSGLSWIAARTGEGEWKRYGADGREVNWRRDETAAGEWLVHGAIRYRFGLSVLGEGEIQFAVPPEAQRFACSLGVDDGSPAPGPVLFTVKLDGQPAGEPVTCRRGEVAREVSLDVRGKQTLSLRVAGGAQVQADWLEARFLLGAPAPAPVSPSP